MPAAVAHALLASVIVTMPSITPIRPIDPLDTASTASLCVAVTAVVDALPDRVIAPPVLFTVAVAVRTVVEAAAVGVMFWVTLIVVPPVTPIAPPVAVVKSGAADCFTGYGGGFPSSL